MTGKFKLVRNNFQEAMWPAILANWGFNYVIGGIAPYTDAASKQNFRVNANCRSERLADMPQNMYAFGFAGSKDSIYIACGIQKNHVTFGMKFP